MEFFKIRRDIPFMRHALVLNGISLITFLVAVFFLFSRGLHLSVEFTGGTLMEVGYSQSADLAAIRSTVDGLGIKDVQVQNFGTAQEVLIRMPAQKGATPGQQSEKVLAALKAADPMALRRWPLWWSASCSMWRFALNGSLPSQPLLPTCMTS